MMIHKVFVRLGGSALIAGLLLLGSLTACGGVRPVPGPNAPTRFESATPSSGDRAGVVASVDGAPISQSDWQRALAVDRAMSALAGQPPPSVEEALQRLINEHLVLRFAEREGLSATYEQAEARLMALLARWGVGEDRLRGALAQAGLTRAQVIEAIRRLLIVEAYLARFGSAESASRWLGEQRRQARVSIYANLATPPNVPPPNLPATPLVLALATATGLPTLAAPTPDVLPPTPPPENAAPDFTLPDLNGQSVSLSQFRGQVVVLQFWASWCPACRAETSEVVAFARRYSQSGVVVLGVNLREDAATARAFAEANGIGYPLLLDDRGEVAALYQVVGIPTTVFIDASGSVRSRHLGVVSADQLAAYVEPLLTQPAPDFALPREDRQLVRLSDYRGRQAVVLAFYRGAGCGACQQWLRALQAEYPRFRARGAEVLAIAVQGVTQASVVKELGGLDFPILADEAHSVSEAFGVFNRLGDGLAGPAVFVINVGGQIVWSYIGQSPDDYPTPQAILERLP